jgi:hypothetical protein
MRGSGGTNGGTGKFLTGFLLAGLATWFFLDSVLVTAGTGWLSGAMPFGWWGTTTSTGFLFLPFAIGVIALFYDARKTWAWGLMYLGLAIIVIEILSRVRFMMQMKTSHLLLLITVFAAGVGLMLQSLRDEAGDPEPDDTSAPPRGGAK